MSQHVVLTFCRQSERTDILEKTQGWKDDEFDLVLQYLRTVLVKRTFSFLCGPTTFFLPVYV